MCFFYRCHRGPEVCCVSRQLCPMVTASATTRWTCSSSSLSRRGRHADTQMLQHSPQVSNDLLSTVETSSFTLTSQNSNRFVLRCSCPRSSLRTVYCLFLLTLLKCCLSNQRLVALFLYL